MLCYVRKDFRKLVIDLADKLLHLDSIQLVSKALGLKGNPLETYLTIGIAIGAIQVFDGAYLLRTSGKMGTIPTVISILEWIWFGITVYYLLNYEFSVLGKILAVSYLSYAITTSLVAWRGVLSGISLENFESFSMPSSYAIAGLCFGIFYGLSCLAVLVMALP